MNDDITRSREWIDDCERWRTRLLTGQYAHWCEDWDFLPVDETTMEWNSCTCFGKDKPGDEKDWRPLGEAALFPTQTVLDLKDKNGITAVGMRFLDGVQLVSIDAPPYRDYRPTHFRVRKSK